MRTLSILVSAFSLTALTTLAGCRNTTKVSSVPGSSPQADISVQLGSKHWLSAGGSDLPALEKAYRNIATQPAPDLRNAILKYLGAEPKAGRSVLHTGPISQERYADVMIIIGLKFPKEYEAVGLGKMPIVGPDLIPFRLQNGETHLQAATKHFIIGDAQIDLVALFDQLAGK